MMEGTSKRQFDKSNEFLSVRALATVLRNSLVKFPVAIIAKIARRVRNVAFEMSIVPRRESRSFGVFHLYKDRAYNLMRIDD